MDANKLEKLREIDYHVPKTCGLCVHSSFPAPTGEWGECNQFTYHHQKHTESRRYLSIYRGGTCSNFQPDPKAMSQLHRYAELVR
jgi:hypothetical protein